MFGERVKQARVLRRRGSSELSESLGWKSARVSKLESKVSTPLDEVEVAQLGEALRFPVAFFAAEPTARVEVRNLLFRSSARMSKAEQIYLAEVTTTVEELIMIATRRRPLPPVRIPTSRNERDVVAMAASMRERLNLAEDEPIGSVTRAAEKSGVVVVARSRQLGGDALTDEEAGTTRERHLGLSAWVGQFNEQPVIMTPAMASWERTRWTIAHELGHLCLHRSNRVDEVAEVEASAFASELLAPIKYIRRELDASVTLTSLVEIKMKWGISIGALIMHLDRNRVIDKQRISSLQKQIYTRLNPDTGRSWGITEPGWDTRTPERPQLLMKWLQKTTGAMTPRQLAAVSGVLLPTDVLADLLAAQLPDSQTDTPTSRRGTDSELGPGDLAPVVPLASRR